MTAFNRPRYSNRVVLVFQGPDWNEQRNDPSKHTASIEVDAFDLDYGDITVDDDLREGTNLTLAVPAPFMNEEGMECGDIGWRIDPDSLLLEKRPDLAQYVGQCYGRIIVHAAKLD